MAEFNPSVISQIPDGAGNPEQAQQQALTLRNLADRGQLAQIEVANAKQDQRESGVLRDLFGPNGMPHSSPAEMNALLEKANTMGVSPTKTMPLVRERQQIEAGDADVKLKQLEVAQAQAGPMISSLDQVLGELQPFKTMVDQGKATQAELNAMTMRRALPKIQSLAQEHPELAQHLTQFLQNPKNITYQGLVTQEASFKQGRELMDQRAKALQQALAERREDTSERRADTADRREAAFEKGQESLINSRNEKAAAAEDSKFDEETIKDMAGQYLAGDKSVLQGLGRGSQGSSNIVALRREIRAQAREAGMSPSDVASKVAEFGGFLSEQRALGTRQAGIEVAATEADKVIPIALRASEAVPRGKFVPVNKLVNAGRVATSDPALARFAQANLTLANVYARAMSPTGTPTVSGRDHALEVLSTATSQESYAGVVDIIKQEIAAARSAPDQVREDVRASFTGGGSQPARTNQGGGKVLRYDAATGTFK